MQVRFTEEFAALASLESVVPVDLTPLEAWVVLGNLQLALRHPENNQMTAEIARNVAKRLQTLVASEGALAEVARMGWHAEFDR